MIDKQIDNTLPTLLENVPSLVKRPIPRKLDDAMILALTDCVSKGNYYHDACDIAGISKFAFYEWIKQAEEDEKAGMIEEDSLYITLANSIKKARAQARASFVEVVREAAVVKREWLPAITYLERTDPTHWGRKDRMQVDVNEKVVQILTISVEGSQKELIEGEYKELVEDTTKALTSPPC